MSQQIKPIKVIDNVIGGITDTLAYAVLSGAESLSIQEYPANSATSTQMIFSVQVPSTSVIVDRNLVVEVQGSVTIAGTPAIGEYLVNLSQVNQVAGTNAPVYGGDCFSPFPLAYSTQTLSCQINNTTVSAQLQSIIDPLLRSVDKTMFERWNAACPTQLDYYGSYYQALCQQYPVAQIPTAGTSAILLQELVVPAFNSPFNTYEDANLNNNLVPRGAFKLISVVGNTPGGTVGGVLQTRNVVITFKSREPVFLSPFLFGEQVSEAGLTGLTQLNFNYSLDSSFRRSFRWVQDAQTTNKVISNITYDQSNCKMICKYYSPKVSDMMIPANVVTPLATYTDYILPVAAGTAGLLAPGASAQLISNSIQLNSYPDKVFIWVDDFRKYETGNDPVLNPQGPCVPDRYASITGVNITLNNHTGILSTFNTNQLYKSSVKSGSQQSWPEFSGLQARWGGTADIVGNDPAQFISTCGSVLVLDMGTEINIPEMYYSPGSLSTCQFQVTVNFTNNQQTPIKPQLNVMMMYSGLLSTANGASSAYTSGVLTKSNVVDSAAFNNPMTTHQLQRYVGGGLRGSMKAIASSILPFLRKELLAPAVEHMGKSAVDRLTRKLKA